MTKEPKEPGLPIPKNIADEIESFTSKQDWLRQSIQAAFCLKTEAIDDQIRRIARRHQIEFELLRERIVRFSQTTTYSLQGAVDAFDTCLMRGFELDAIGIVTITFFS